MKVLHVFKSFYPDTRGGIEECISQLCTYHSRQYGDDCTLITTSKLDVARKYDENDFKVIRCYQNINVASTPVSYEFFRRFSLAVADSDIVNFHFPWPMADLAWLIGNCDKPYVVTYHSDIVRQKISNFLYSFIRKRFLGGAAAIIATSPNYVDTSTACAKRVAQRRKGKGNAPPKTAAAEREKTSQKCDRKASDGASYKTNDANAVVKDSSLPAASDPHCQSPPKSKVSNSSSLKLTGSKSSVQSSNDDATKHNKTNTTSSNLDDTSGAFKVSPAEAASGESPSTHAPERSKTDAPKSSGAGAPKSASSETDQPERSHYCKLCEKQILRRDHHCFFMTVCVGYRNHKHFIFFCLYMMIGALYGVVLTAR